MARGCRCYGALRLKCAKNGYSRIILVLATDSLRLKSVRHIFEHIFHRCRGMLHTRERVHWHREHDRDRKKLARGGILGFLTTTPTLPGRKRWTTIVGTMTTTDPGAIRVILSPDGRGVVYLNVVSIGIR